MIKPQYRQFKRSCPTCASKDKIILKCGDCLKYMCSECSIESLCLDCYILLNERKEKSVYNFDKQKYREEVKI